MMSSRFENAACGGLLFPDRGRVIIEGQVLNDLDEFGLNEMRKKFGMLFQMAALFDSLTVWENVGFSRTGRKIAGVCAGFAEYFDLDVTLIRLVWLVAGILMLPFWVIGYIVAWIVVPDQPEIVAIMPAGAPVTQQQG